MAIAVKDLTQKEIRSLQKILPEVVYTLNVLGRAHRDTPGLMGITLHHHFISLDQVYLDLSHQLAPFRDFLSTNPLLRHLDNPKFYTPEFITQITPELNRILTTNLPALADSTDDSELNQDTPENQEVTSAVPQTSPPKTPPSTTAPEPQVQKYLDIFRAKVREIEAANRAAAIAARTVIERQYGQEISGSIPEKDIYAAILRSGNRPNVAESVIRDLGRFHPALSQNTQEITQNLASKLGSAPQNSNEAYLNAAYPQAALKNILQEAIDKQDFTRLEQSLAELTPLVKHRPEISELVKEAGEEARGHNITAKAKAVIASLTEESDLHGRLLQRGIGPEAALEIETRLKGQALFNALDPDQTNEIIDNSFIKLGITAPPDSSIYQAAHTLSPATFSSPFLSPNAPITTLELNAARRLLERVGIDPQGLTPPQIVSAAHRFLLDTMPVKDQIEFTRLLLKHPSIPEKMSTHLSELGDAYSASQDPGPNNSHPNPFSLYRQVKSWYSPTTYPASSRSFLTSVRTFFQNPLGSIRSFFGQGGSFRNAFSNLGSSLKNGFSKLAPTLKNLLSSAGSGLKNLLGTGLKGLGALGKKALQALASKGLALLGSLISASAPAWLIPAAVIGIVLIILIIIPMSHTSPKGQARTQIQTLPGTGGGPTPAGGGELIPAKCPTYDSSNPECPSLVGNGYPTSCGCVSWGPEGHGYNAVDIGYSNCPSESQRGVYACLGPFTVVGSYFGDPTNSGSNAGGSYGNWVDIKVKINGKDVVIRYAHLAQYTAPAITAGSDSSNQCVQIGIGDYTGTQIDAIPGQGHLHMEVRSGGVSTWDVLPDSLKSVGACIP